MESAATYSPYLDRVVEEEHEKLCTTDNVTVAEAEADAGDIYEVPY